MPIITKTFLFFITIKFNYCLNSLIIISKFKKAQKNAINPTELVFLKKKIGFFPTLSDLPDNPGSRGIQTQCCDWFYPVLEINLVGAWDLVNHADLLLLLFLFIILVLNLGGPFGTGGWR